jgi:hypothetical protein
VILEVFKAGEKETLRKFEEPTYRTRRLAEEEARNKKGIIEE